MTSSSCAAGSDLSGMFSPSMLSVCAASKVGDDKAALEAQEMEVMTRTAAAGVQVLTRLESTRAVCDCMAAIMSGDLIPKPKEGNDSSSPQHLTPSERLLPLSHPRASPGTQSPEWVADLLVAVLQRAGQHRRVPSFAVLRLQQCTVTRLTSADAAQKPRTMTAACSEMLPLVKSDEVRKPLFKACWHLTCFPLPVLCVLSRQGTGTGKAKHVRCPQAAFNIGLHGLSRHFTKDSNSRSWELTFALT